ncbi:MAG: hypothetical protein QMD77_02825 [Patescibacteria group bacterium]|nr:hypothetical protein [Patescibacteria group bacterium]
MTKYKKEEGEMAIKELGAVTFQREHMLKRPMQEDLPTLEDTDEHKLPALNKLLLQMHALHAALKTLGIQPQKDKDDQYPNDNLYLLQDADYQGWPRFLIRLKSNWFDPKYPIALHGGFYFHLFVAQDGYEGRYEIADWINIQIRHVNTTPLSFVSWREHIRTLGFFLREQSDSYFYDIPMPFQTGVSFSLLSDGMNFKTEALNLAVDNACTVMQKIINRGQFLRAATEE